MIKNLILSLILNFKILFYTNDDDGDDISMSRKILS